MSRQGTIRAHRGHGPGHHPGGATAHRHFERHHPRPNRAHRVHQSRVTGCQARSKRSPSPAREAPRGRSRSSDPNRGAPVDSPDQIMGRGSSQRQQPVSPAEPPTPQQGSELRPNQHPAIGCEPRGQRQQRRERFRSISTDGDCQQPFSHGAVERTIHARCRNWHHQDRIRRSH